jgi:tRNA pseudouridine65 synthase
MARSLELWTPTVLFDDPRFLVVDKPAGAVVHRSSEHKDASIIVLQAVRDLLGVHVFAVHRLDRPTSGVLLLAKDSEAVAPLHEALAAGSKRYAALVRGLTPEAGEINRPLKSEDSGLPQTALTRFQRRAVYQLGPQFGAVSLVDVWIETGRRHQIRRHFAGLAHHLILDTNYGKGAINRHCRDTLGLTRLFLHASELALTNPWTAAELRVEAPLAPDLLAFLRRLAPEELV